MVKNLKLGGPVHSGARCTPVLRVSVHREPLRLSRGGFGKSVARGVLGTKLAYGESNGALMNGTQLHPVVTLLKPTRRKGK